MKVRSDSPFACLTDEEQMLLLEISERLTIEQMVPHVEKLHPDLNFSIPSLRRFVRRLREESLRDELEESAEAMDDFAKHGRAGRARDGVLEAMRRKMFAQALDDNNPAMAMTVFNMMKQEQKEDRTLALQERRLALEEENAKHERRLRELDHARSALALLPRLHALLTDESPDATPEQRLQQARHLLQTAGAQLLLPEKSAI